MGSKDKALERFMQSKEFQKIQAEVEREEQEKASRMEAAAELRELKAGREAKLKPLREQERQAERDVQEARDALQEAVGRRSRVQNEMFTVNYLHEQRVRELEHYLRKTAPRSLKDQVESLQMEKDRIQGVGYTAEIYPDIPSNFGYSRADIGRMRQEKKSNYQEHLERIQAVDADIARVEQEILKGGE